MSPALALHDETPSPNLKVTNNPLKARLLFTVSTFGVMWSELSNPHEQEHSCLAKQLPSPPLRAHHQNHITVISETAGTKDSFAGLYYRSSITILTVAMGRGTQVLAMQHFSNPANAALKAELQMFSKEEQPSLHICLLSTG